MNPDLHAMLIERESYLARLRTAYKFSESEAIYFADTFDAEFSEAEHLSALYGNKA